MSALAKALLHAREKRQRKLAAFFARMSPLERETAQMIVGLVNMGMVYDFKRNLWKRGEVVTYPTQQQLDITWANENAA